MKCLTIRGYARHRGVSHSAVRRAIKDGRISKQPDGTIDATRADRQWELRTDPTKPLNSVTGEPKHRRQAGAPPSPMGSHGAGNEGGNEASDRVPSNYAAARAVRETYLARLSKLEYERASGKLVDVDEVRAAVFQKARTTRDGMMAIPSRVAPILAALTDPAKIHDVLLEEIRRVCFELSRPPVIKGAEKGD
jgi:hypothetical protein